MILQSKHLLWNRISTNLISTFILVSVLPIVVVVLFVMPNIHTQVENQIANQLQSVVELKQQLINTWLLERHTVLNLLQSDPDHEQAMITVLKSSTAGDLSPEDLRLVNNLLRNAIEADARFQEFFLYDRSGQVVAASDPITIGKVLTHRPYFETSLKGDFVHPPYYEVGIESITMMMGIPLYSAEGEVLGVLAGRPDVGALGRIMIERTGLGTTGETYLVSAESHYMVTPSLYIEEGYPLTHAYFSDGITSALQEMSGSSSYTNYRGMPVIGSYRWLPELRVALIAEIEEVEALASFSIMQNFVFAITFVGAGLALLIGLYVTTRITRPIELLTQTASRLAQGDLDQRATIPRLYELGIFATTFNEMSARLKESIVSLEQRLTELRQAQNALSKSEERYRSIVETAEEGIWLIDEEANTTYVNPKMADMLGYSPSEMLGRSLYDFMDDLATLDAEQNFERRRQEIQEQRDFRFTHKDGRDVWTNIATNPIVNEDGQFVAALAMITDTTERRRTEQALIESEERYSLVVAGVNDGVWDWNILTDEDYLSARWKEILGYRDDELPNISSSFFNQIHPDDQAHVSEAVTRHFEENVPYHEEIRMRHKDGSYRWILARGKAIRNAEGKAIRMAGSITDITERKQTEQQIAYQANLLQNVTDAIYATDINLNITSWNNAAEKLYGWQAEEVIGKSVAEIITIEYVNQTSAEVREILFEQGSWSGEAKHQRRDKSILNILASAQLLRDPRGQIVGAVGISHDITQRKKAEEALKHSEERFRTVSQMVTNNAFSMKYDKAKEQFVSEWVFGQMDDLIGYTPEEFYVTIGMDKIYHPDDLDRAVQDSSITMKGTATSGEYRLITKSGEIKWLSIRRHPEWDDDHQHVIRYFGTVQDITERKQAEEALRKSEANYRTLVENSPDSILRVDLDHRIKYINTLIQDLTEEQVIGTLVYEFVPPSFADTVKDSLDKVMVTRAMVSYETQGPGPDGTWRWYETRVLPIVEDDQVIEFTMVATDITESHKLAQELRASEVQLRTIFEQAAVGICYSDINGRFLRANQKLCDITGYTSTELIQMDFQEITHPDDLELDLDYVKQSLSGVIHTYSIEKRYFQKNGELIWVNLTVSLVRNEQSEPVYFIGVIENITAQKQAALSLQLSEEHLRQSISVGHIGTFDHDHDRDSVYWSPELRVIYGYGSDEPIAVKAGRKHIYADDLERIDAAVVDAWNPKSKGIFDVEYRIVNKDGAIRWISTRSRTTFEGKGANRHPVRTIGAVMDITERKRVEEALRQSEERYMLVIQGSNDGIWDWDILNDNMYLSPRWKSILGYNDDELLPVPAAFFNLIHPDDQDDVRIAVASYLQEPENIATYSDEVRILHKDGSYRWILSRGQSVYDSDGQPVRMAGSITDITERKQQEEALRSSEARYRTLIQSAGEAVVLFDCDGRFLILNESAAQSLGQDVDDVLGKTLHDFLPEEIATTRVKVIREIFDSGQGHNLEIPLISQDELHWYQSSTQPVKDETGKVTAVLSLSIDVTDRKQAEEALREREARLRRAESMISMGHYSSGLDGTNFHVSDGYKRIWGIDLDSTPTLEDMIELIHPDEKEGMVKKIEKSFGVQQDYELEYRIIRKDGETRIVRSITEVTIDKQSGKSTRFGTVIDITEQKQAEADLRDSEARTLALLNALPDAMFGFDNEENFIEYKPSDKFPLMMPPEDFIGKNLHDILPPDVARQTAFNIQMAHETGDVQSFEYLIDMPDGLHDYEARVFAFEDDRSFVIVRDISERKQAEKHIREQARLLDLIFEHMPDSFAILDQDFNFTRVSESYAKADGHDVDYYLGRNHFDIYPSDFEEEANDVKQNKYIYKKNAHPFVYADHPEWGVTYWDLGLVPILDNDNEIELFLFTLKNVTDQIIAEQEIRDLNEDLEQRVINRTRELEEVNVEIRHFAYIVSHDLRAPLVNLKGFSAVLRSASELLKKELVDLISLIEDSSRRTKLQRALEQDIPEALRFIESSVSTMDTFTKAILKLSRLGRSQLDVVEVDIQLLVRKIIDGLSHQIREQNITVTIGDLPIIRADSLSMEQIFSNILSNAISYLAPDRAGEIEVSAEQNEKEVIFHIQDNGSGIAQEFEERVFSPFRRAGKHEVPGEGMGLAYVQTLVRRHGGEIWFDSELGVGTTFSFTIALIVDNANTRS